MEKTLTLTIPGKLLLLIPLLTSLPTTPAEVSNH
jgi:hypothetical protein